MKRSLSDSVYPLIDAARANDIRSAKSILDSFSTEDVHDLLKEVYNLSAWYTKYTTPLQEAAKHGHAQMVQLFLDYGADPTYRNEWGIESARTLAENNGYKEVAVILEKAEKQHEMAITIQQQTRLIQELYNKIDELQKQVPGASQPHTVKDFKREEEEKENMQKAVFKAIDEGNLGRITQYSQSKYFQIDAKDKHGNTALHIAAMRGDVKIFQFVLGLAIQNNNGLTSPNNAEQVKTLLNAPGCNGNTVLHFVVSFAALSQYVIELGADSTIPNKSSETPLHLAAEKSIEATRTIVEQLQKISPDKSSFKVHLNARNNEGNTPLHYGARNAEIYHYLTEEGADSTYLNNKKATLLHDAAIIGPMPMLDYEAGYNARKIQCIEESKRIIGSWKATLTEEAFKALLNAPNNRGATALALASQDNPALCEYLIEEGADSTLPHYQYKNLLHNISCTQLNKCESEKYKEYMTLAKAIVKKWKATLTEEAFKGQLNAIVDTEGNTVLHLIYYNTKASPYLMEQGADPTIRNKENKSLLDNAMHTRDCFMLMMNACNDKEKIITEIKHFLAEKLKHPKLYSSSRVTVENELMSAIFPFEQAAQTLEQKKETLDAINHVLQKKGQSALTMDDVDYDCIAAKDWVRIDRKVRLQGMLFRRIDAAYAGEADTIAAFMHDVTQEAVGLPDDNPLARFNYPYRPFYEKEVRPVLDNPNEALIRAINKANFLSAELALVLGADPHHLMTTSTSTILMHAQDMAERQPTDSRKQIVAAIEKSVEKSRQQYQSNGQPLINVESLCLKDVNLSVLLPSTQVTGDTKIMVGGQLPSQQPDFGKD